MISGISKLCETPLGGDGFIQQWVKLDSEMENIAGSERVLFSDRCGAQVCCRNDLSCVYGGVYSMNNV